MSGETCENLMKKYECSKVTIRNYLKKFEIKSPIGFYKIQGKKVGKAKGSKCSDAQKELMSKKFSGVGNPFYGKKHTPETCKKMSGKRPNITGDSNPFKKSLLIPENLIKHKKRCKTTWENRGIEYRCEFGDRQKKGFGEITGSFWARVKSNAKTRKLELSISIEDCWELFLQQNRKCALSGVDIIFTVRYKDFNKTTASLDRINSKLGYITGNVQWVHKKINLMKRELTDKEFISYCEKVVEYNESKKSK